MNRVGSPRTARRASGDWTRKYKLETRGRGLRSRLRENGLSIVVLVLFILTFGAHAVAGMHEYNDVVSFVLHAIGGAREYAAEQLQHGSEGVSVLQYMQTARFWFESSQNWQSEFLALLGMVRQRGSPESKPVDAPQSQTGSE
jgi:hypothetical protein